MQPIQIEHRTRVVWALLGLVCTGAIAQVGQSDVGTPGAGAAFASADGLITVQRPVSDSWECLQSRQKQDDDEVTIVKCRLQDPKQYFVMMAKDYTVHVKEARSAEQLSNSVYKKTYSKLYTSVKYVSSEDVKHRGHEAYEVRFNATHDRLGAIVKTERVIVDGEHILVLSVEGSPPLVDSMKDVAEGWFSTAEFASLPARAATP